jgi:class 3 adenylate cyclase
VNITSPWERLLTNTRGRSSASLVTGFSSSSTIPCPVQIRACRRCTWRSRCATRWRSSLKNGAASATSSGSGIAYGYATLGTIGYEGRLQYSVTGKVANLAARLCGEATDGPILIEINVRNAAEAHGDIEFVGELNLEGFSRPTKAFNVLKLKSMSSSLDYARG